ncbi:Esa1p-associated factor [Diaporthe australafricana]|uniref:Chromatin modification-related protein EAF3 n=1 Tax=Diaporthe australafricana TaxID=127596 RepID=A0ABR3WME0_9PEZI
MAPSSKPAAPPYTKDEKVLCFHHDMLYEAKIIEIDSTEEGGFRYKIHYKGWKATWDDWVPQDRIRKLNDENRELAAQLNQQARASLQKKSGPAKKAGLKNGSDFSSARGSEERSGAAATMSGRGRKRDFDLENAFQDCLQLLKSSLESSLVRFGQFWQHVNLLDALLSHPKVKIFKRAVHIACGRFRSCINPPLNSPLNPPHPFDSLSITGPEPLRKIPDVTLPDDLMDAEFVKKEAQWHKAALPYDILSRLPPDNLTKPNPSKEAYTNYFFAKTTETPEGLVARRSDHYADAWTPEFGPSANKKKKKEESPENTFLNAGIPPKDREEFNEELKRFRQENCPSETEDLPDPIVAKAVRAEKAKKAAADRERRAAAKARSAMPPAQHTRNTRLRAKVTEADTMAAHDQATARDATATQEATNTMTAPVAVEDTVRNRQHSAPPFMSLMRDTQSAMARNAYMSRPVQGVVSNSYYAAMNDSYPKARSLGDEPIGDDFPAVRSQGQEPAMSEPEAPNTAAPEEAAAPKAAAPKRASNKTAASKTAAPKTVASKTATPKTAAPKTAAPKTAVPKTAAPKTAAPKTAAPKTAAPKTAAPKTAAAKTAATKSAPTKAASSKPGEDQSAPIKQPRAMKACEPCRTHKTRCIGGTPCEACVRRNFNCVFPPDGRKAPIKRALEEDEEAVKTEPLDKEAVPAGRPAKRARMQDATPAKKRAREEDQESETEPLDKEAEPAGRPAKRARKDKVTPANKTGSVKGSGHKVGDTKVQPSKILPSIEEVPEDIEGGNTQPSNVQSFSQEIPEGVEKATIQPTQSQSFSQGRITRSRSRQLTEEAEAQTANNQPPQIQSFGRRRITRSLSRQLTEEAEEEAAKLQHQGKRAREETVEPSDLPAKLHPAKRQRKGETYRAPDGNPELLSAIERVGHAASVTQWNEHDLEPTWMGHRYLDWEASFAYPNIDLRTQDESFHNRPSIKLTMTDVLKGILVDDWEHVTKDSQLVPLPHAHPVVKILDDYLDDEMPKREEDSAQIDILKETMAGLREYFDRALGRILLYRFERLQYSELLPQWENEKDGGPSSVYGGEHLCRLLVSLPELLAQTNMDQQSVNRLREELTKFTNWLSKNGTKYFVREYEVPGPEYQDKAKSS